MNDYEYINSFYKKYRTPDETILSSRDNNNLSHIFGGYYLASKYNPFWATILSAAKEPPDILKEVLFRNNDEKWDDKLFKKVNDSIFDLENSDFGIKLYKQNPYMTDKEVLDFAYKKAIKNYLNQDRPLEVQKKIYGQILDNNSNKDIMYYYE